MRIFFFSSTFSPHLHLLRPQLMSGAYLDVIGTAPSFNSNPERNYVDALNLTCPITPRVLQQFVGVRPHFARARPPLPGLLRVSPTRQCSCAFSLPCSQS